MKLEIIDCLFLSLLFGFSQKCLKSEMRRYWPICFLLFAWACFASPYFFKGRIPLSTTYVVNNFHPWKAYFGLPVKNAIPDVITQIFPWKKLTIESLKFGKWPLWDPYNFSGAPHLANFQSAVLSPFNFLFFLFPFLDAWSLLVLLQTILAALFTFLYCRKMGISQLGSSLAGLSFSFCGFLVVWLLYGTLGYAILFLPLALWALENFFEKKKFSHWLLLIFSLTLSLFSGHIQTSLYLYLAVLVYTFTSFFLKRVNLKILFLISLAFFVSILLAAPQLLSTIEFYQFSSRQGRMSFENLKSSAIPPFYLLATLLAPDFFGNPVTRNDWYGYYAEWSSFAGVWPLVLAVLGLFLAKKKNWPILSIGLLSISLALFTPISFLLWKTGLPVFSNSNPARSIVLLSFTIAVLSGFGFDAFVKLYPKKIKKKSFTPLLIFFFAFLILWLFVFKNRMGLSFIWPNAQTKVSLRNLILPSALFLAGSGAIFLGLLKKDFAKVIPYILLFLTFFDLFRFARKWTPFEPKDLAYPRVPVLEFFSEKQGIDRNFGLFGMEVNTTFGFYSPQGYNPLNLSRYGELIDMARETHLVKRYRIEARLETREKNTLKLLNLLGIKYLFYDAVDPKSPFVFPVWEHQEGFAEIYNDGHYLIFENKNVVSRPSLFYQYEIVEKDEEIIKRLFSSDFSLEKSLILKEKPEIDISPQGEGGVELIDYQRNSSRFRVFTSKPALLLLSDNFYPGWKAFVDKKPVKIYRADYTFRAVSVPEGEHEVEFSYQPESFKWGLRISMVTVVILLSCYLVNKKSFLLGVFNRGI